MSTNTGVLKFNPPTHDTDSLGWAGMMGTNAYIDGLAINANPYALGTAQRQSWSGGWLRAQVQGWCDPDTASAPPGTKKAPPVEHYDYKRDRNGAIFAAVFLAALVLSCFWWAVAAHAEAIYPHGGMECMPIEEKAAAMVYAAGHGKVQTFDADSSKRLLATINAMKPATDYEASVVDIVNTGDGPFPIHVFYTDDKLFCLGALFKPEDWNKVTDKAFGAGT